MESLQAKLHKSELQRAQQKSNILAANHTIQAGDSQFENLEDKIASLDFAVHICSKALPTHVDEIVELNLNRKNQQLEQKIQQYERTIQSKNEEIVRITSNYENLNSEHAKLRQQNLELEVQTQRLKEQQNEAGVENGLKKIKEELALKARNYNGLQKEYVDLERQLNAKNIEIFSLKKKLEVSEGFKEQQNKSGKENGLKQIKEELGLKARNYNGLQKEYADLERQLNAKNIEIFSLKKKLEVSERLKEQQNEIHEENGSDWQVKKLKEELALKARNYNALEKECADLKSQLNVKNIEIYSLKRKLQIGEAR